MRSKFNETTLHNVTLEGPAFIETVDYFPCPVCGERCLIKYSKKKKPYFTCNDCGIQVFVRGHNGINRFFTMLKKDFCETHAILRKVDYLEALKKKLLDLEDKQSLFIKDENISRQERLLKQEIDSLQKELKEQERTRNER